MLTPKKTLDSLWQPPKVKRELVKRRTLEGCEFSLEVEFYPGNFYKYIRECSLNGASCGSGSWRDNYCNYELRLKGRRIGETAP